MEELEDDMAVGTNQEEKRCLYHHSKLTELRGVAVNILYKISFLLKISLYIKIKEQITIQISYFSLS